MNRMHTRPPRLRSPSCRARRAPLLLLATFAAFAACDVGDGSEIGPDLPILPDASCKVVVLDDQGRGVVGATVTVDGGARAITGRNGRSDLLASPRGRRVVRVDAADAAATAGDRLASYRVALSITGQDLPAALHVPELPDAASVVLPAGTQAGTTTVTSTAGASLLVPAGCSVGAPGGAADVVVRLGDLQTVHLPGDLPVAASGAWLFGRGLWIDPAGATFTPPADLDVPDELGIGAGGTASLFRLDQTTGEWLLVADDAVGTGSRLVVSGAVAEGGLFVFGQTVPAATVSGRVVSATGITVANALVRVDHLHTTSGGDGRFVVERVAAVAADGAPRSAAIELFAGGSWLPARAQTTAPLPTSLVEVGDLTLDTLLAGNVRVQQVVKGRADAVRPARLSTLRGDVALTTTSDANGQVVFEDVPCEYFGFQEGRAIDSRDVLYGQAVAYLDLGRRWVDANQFLQERTWYLGGRRSRTLVTDALGSGPLENAWVVQGAVPGEGRVGETREAGALFASRDFAGRATASRRSERDGRVLISAFSIVDPFGDHTELPLQRLRRSPVAAFDRHGLVAGTLLGADPARQHELRATRRLSVQEWWDEIAEGGPAPSSLPLDVDPAATHAEFVVGVPAIGGNVAVAELTSPGGVKTLQALGVLADLLPTEGQRIARDVALDALATTNFVVAGALATAPPELDLAQLTMALALQQPSGRIVDAARGLRGNHVAAGGDLVLTLPPLGGPLAGHGWLALLDGSWANGGSTLRCSALISVPRPSPLPAFPNGAVTFGAFPTLSAPANGAAVPAAGFTVQLALPANALHGALELRSDTGAEVLSWQVILPPYATEFAFVTLPQDVPTPLLPGRTWTLTVSAYFGDGAIVGALDPYSDLSAFVQSIGAVERGANVVTRRSIQITTN